MNNDLISRKALKREFGYTDEWYKGRTVCAIIDNVPTVEERPKGKWIELPKALNYNELPCSCSACAHILSFYYGYPKSNFCPNCGADMRGDMRD